MENNFAEIKKLNKEACELATVEGWAAWYEGEEGWGAR